MSIEVRPALQAEMFDFGGVVAYVYAGSFGDEPDNVAAQNIKPEWTLCAFVDGQMAATFATLPMTMCVLGNDVAMGGISAVGTLPEFRRRGLIRQIMTRAMETMRDKGQAVTTLWASQAAIYQRYGYAMMSVMRRYEIDTADIRFFDGNDGSGTVTRVDVRDGFTEAESVYNQFIPDRIGYLRRRHGTWAYNVLADNESDGPLHLAICHQNGLAVGYVAYTVRSGKIEHRTRGQQLKIRELVALNGEAYRRLWSFVASHDLVGKVIWEAAPADDPAMELMMEPRLLHCQDNEGLWLRIVDVTQALAERGYVNDGALTIAVSEDQLAPWNTGTWDLVVQAGKATLTKSLTTADITLSIKALATLYAGFRTASDLSRAGLVTGDRTALFLADKLFATPHKPHCPDNF